MWKNVGQLSYWTGCCGKTAQVAASESHRFWDDVLGYGVRANNMHAMVVDTLTTWFLGYTSRINNTDAHERWLDGYLGPSHGKGPGGATKCVERIAYPYPQPLFRSHAHTHTLSLSLARA